MRLTPHIVTPRNRVCGRASKGAANSGFTLIELLVVIAIIAILMSLLVGAGRFARRKALVGRATADLQKLANELNEYYVKNGEYPETLQPVSNAVGGRISFVDPWGNAYRYAPSSLHAFELYCLGPNTSLDADDIYVGR